MIEITVRVTREVWDRASTRQPYVPISESCPVALALRDAGAFYASVGPWDFAVAGLPGSHPGERRGTTPPELQKIVNAFDRRDDFPGEVCTVVQVY